MLPTYNIQMLPFNTTTTTAITISENVFISL